MNAPNRHWTFLCICLILGGGLRMIGLTRGIDGGAFYTFHPDETMVIEAALAPLTPTDPPLTTYGMLPSYALRATLEASAWILGWEEVGLEGVEDRQRVYCTARILAALYSMGTMVLVWMLGRRYFGERAAALALVSVAFAAGAIQQAHFYIVDGLFVLLSTACLWVIGRALEERDWRWSATAGALIGLAGAVRLNGTLLGLILLVGHGWIGGDSWRTRIEVFRRRDLWLAAAIAVLALCAVQPFLLTDPGRLWQVHSARDFAFSLQMVRGELLQPWLLVDLHTVPYVHHWTHLWPLIAGWPLTLFFVPALVYAVRRADLPRGLMLLWCGLYFLMVGGLVIKPVRYIVPLVPFFALFAGQLGAVLWCYKVRWWRLVGRAVVVAVWAYGTVYGTALARLYTAEDSRIQAARWVRDNVPVENRIGAEGGGFSMRGVLGGNRTLVPVDVPRLFYSGPYMLCGTQVDHLGERLKRMEYMALVVENRRAQFSAVPELFPVVADFYRRLLGGELGFDLVQRFKNYPGIGSWEWIDDGAEPSFLGYDHPAVSIFKLRDRAALEAGLQQWREEIERDPGCPDAPLRQVAAAMQEGDWRGARRQVDEISHRYESTKLTHLLASEIYRNLGEEQLAQEAMSRYRPEDARGITAHVRSSAMIHNAAPSAAGSLARLGLADLALQVLGSRKVQTEEVVQEIVDEYIGVASIFFERRQFDHMERVLQYANQIRPTSKATNVLAKLAYQRDEIDAALELWQESLGLDAEQAEVHKHLGLVLMTLKHEYARAVSHLERAVQLDPTLVEEVKQWLVRGGIEVVEE